MSSVIIVGNGPSILQEEMGKDIDEFDIIIRMKRCTTQLDFPQYFGSRTDILAGSLTIAPFLKNIKADMYWILLDSRHENAEAMRYLNEDIAWQYKALNMEHHKDISDEWRMRYLELRDSRPIPEMHPQMAPSRYCDARGERHPSQGFQTLVYAASQLRPEKIALVGFDNIMTGEFTWSVTRGPTWDNYPQHRWDIEHDMIPMVAEEYDCQIGFMIPDTQEQTSDCI